MSPICSICGSSVTVQDREGTAFCYTCECEGLRTRIKELEAALRELRDGALVKPSREIAAWAYRIAAAALKGETHNAG